MRAVRIIKKWPASIEKTAVQIIYFWTAFAELNDGLDTNLEIAAARTRR